MIVFWRDRPLTGPEYALVEALEIAHRKSAMRGNASSVALKLSAGGSGSFEMALASAILTLGGNHAPILKIYKLLELPIDELLNEVEERLNNKEIVEGFGNSFFKNRPDPDWEPVREHLLKFEELSIKVTQVTALLHQYGKILYPNAGMYTAAAAIAIEIPASVASFLLIQARLPVWASMASKEL